MGKGGKKEKEEGMRTGFFGGWPKPWTRGSPSVATRRAELPRRWRPDVGARREEEDQCTA